MAAGGEGAGDDRLGGISQDDSLLFPLLKRSKTQQQMHYKLYSYIF